MLGRNRVKLTWNAPRRGPRTHSILGSRREHGIAIGYATAAKRHLLSGPECRKMKGLRSGSVQPPPHRAISGGGRGAWARRLARYASGCAAPRVKSHPCGGAGDQQQGGSGRSGACADQKQGVRPQPLAGSPLGGAFAWPIAQRPHHSHGKAYASSPTLARASCHATNARTVTNLPSRSTK